MKTIRELWALDAEIQKIAEQIQLFEEKRNAVASVLHEQRHDLDLLMDIPLAQKTLIDSTLAQRVKPTSLKGLRVCGIDGGLLKKTALPICFCDLLSGKNYTSDGKGRFNTSILARS